MREPELAELRAAKEQIKGYGAIAMAGPSKVPLKEQLQKEMDDYEVKLQKVKKLLQMLEEHPELETTVDFLELLPTRRY